MYQKLLGGRSPGVGGVKRWWREHDPQQLWIHKSSRITH